ncbi:hypothetical protein FJ976_02850 [Mesorhizobium sp. B1-1-9]|uniref:hypothetical protein n=1 Tax=Mesorhizobium sp. B1-1-9 TaxID=2589975 RepID=UPI00112D2D53|nr:hypothetical protein [Mesorhizobium sp. B1-1-9]TPN57593.1 hypothetical protein FJ976_02850 [Mesorhizobium sp. B1-1-9]
MTIRPDNIPTIDDLYLFAAIGHLASARNHLQAAVFKFDDAGYEHDPTSRAYSFVASIFAEFNGRQGLSPAPSSQMPTNVIPDHVVQAAREYRRQARRTY